MFVMPLVLGGELLAHARQLALGSNQWNAGVTSAHCVPRQAGCGPRWQSIRLVSPQHHGHMSYRVPNRMAFASRWRSRCEFSLLSQRKVTWLVTVNPRALSLVLGQRCRVCLVSSVGERVLHL